MPDQFKNTMTLQDAMKITGPRSFNLMLKPAGSLCNLDCHYCYYLDKTAIYGGREPRMNEEMLETVIRDYISANDVSEVQFNWHGGEPTILGLDFYRKAIELEKKYAGEKIIHNTLQTNATLLNREWARFFRENDFLIGVSIDGPKDIHDKYRKDKGGQPSFDRVMRGIGILSGEGVQFNTMSTINHCSEGRGLEVYQFLKSIGSHYQQYMPVLEHVKYPKDTKGRQDKKQRPYIVDPDTPDSQLAIWSVESLSFGKFMTDIFDYWVRNDVGRWFIGLFDATLACWCGVQPGTCIYGQTCGDNAVIEHNGDVYPCDHFVYTDRILGNINDSSLSELMCSEKMISFGIEKRNSLPKKCRNCQWLFACNGECPKHRFNKTEKGETGMNALCEGYRYFYSHVAPYMEKMKQLILEKQAPAAIIPWARLK
ncbi:MAG: anaerobic sulfatase maturase [Rikenellaceae bacterium]|nr:anaerobic sulfatase maturase [Rikenellaceae bacterium]